MAMSLAESCKDVFKDLDMEPKEAEKLDKLVVLKFDIDKKGKLSSKYKNTIVFPYYGYDDTFKPGEMWICELRDSSLTVYHAIPHQKIDEQFLFKLNNCQHDKIAEHIWEKHRAQIEPKLHDIYGDETAKHLQQEIKNATEEYASVIKQLKENIAELEARNRESDSIIASLHEKLKVSESKPVSSSPSPFVSIPSVSFISVARSEPDTLTSEQFTESRYFVHMAADQRTLLIRPNLDGNVVCIDKTMTLNGMGMLSPFGGRVELTSEYNSRLGGILVHL